MGAIVGIDLGTTNTVVATVSDSGPVALPDETGSTLVPSVVSFLPSGAVLVGDAAKQRRQQDPKNTIFSVKRLIGRTWETEEVRRARGRFPFELREGPGRATFVIAHGETYTLPEISAFVLRKAKSIAELAIGEPVERAVITVPANFNDLQRAATKVAGRVAGLEVLRILNEPTAAALAYGHAQGNAERIAVYDFGGGTFDVTLLALTDSVFEVLSTAGNTFLGGDDVDTAIAERMASEVLLKHRADPRAVPLGFEHLRAAAEQVKWRLSSDSSVSEQIDDIVVGPEQTVSLRFNMSRIELERLITPIVDRTFDVCREALDMAGIGIEDLDHVLLVGGSTRIPFVRDRVSNFFNRSADAQVDAHEVVALGAAIQAHTLTAARLGGAAVPAAPRPHASAGADDPARGSPGRARRLTNPGLGTSKQEEPPQRPAQTSIQPPDGPIFGAAPITRDLTDRTRKTTGIGLGPDELEPDTTEDSFAGVLEAAEEALSEAPATPPIPVNLDRSVAGTRARPEHARKPREPAAVQNVSMPPLPLIGHQTPGGEPFAPIPSPSPVPDKDEVTRVYSPDPSPDQAENLPAIAARPAKDDSRRRRVAESRSAPDPVEPPDAPIADDQTLRARYGDLPLIVGGRRVGGSAAATDRPGQSTRRSRAPENGDGTDLPANPRDRGAVAATYEKAAPAPAPNPFVTARMPTAEAPKNRNPSTVRMPLPPPAPAPTRHEQAIETIEDDEVEFIPPPSSSPGRASMRPSMRADPIQEAQLPIPDVPLPPPAPAPRVRLEPTLEARTSLSLGSSATVQPQEPSPFGDQLPGAPNTLASAAAGAAAAGMAGFGSIGARTSNPPAAGPASMRPSGSPAMSPRLGGAPLLIDVTPLTLCVETAGGYSDAIVERNTPVPCERTRNFVTANDEQESVWIRVAQGEAPSFADNVLLGEVHLGGLSPAPRGSVQIQVTFAIDSDGLLQVRATDAATGRAASAELRLLGMPSGKDATAMAARQAAHFGYSKPDG